MANSGWTADPDSVQVPPDATDNEPRVYIGPDDPNALAFSQLASIMFYWANNRAFMFSIEANPGGNSSEFHLWSFDDDEIKQIIDIVHDDDLTFGEDHSSLAVGQDSSLYEVSLRARQQIIIEADGEPAPDSPPTVFLGGLFEPEYAGVFPADVEIFGKPLPRGIRNNVGSTVSGTAVGTTETVVMTLPSHLYRANRAYEVKVAGQIVMSSAANVCQFRLRKTNASGTVLADWGRNGVTTTNGETLNLDTRCFWVDGSGDVTATLVLTAVASAGTVTMAAGASFPRKTEIWDAGHRFDFEDYEPQLS